MLQHGGIPPYPETEEYVARILGIVGGKAPSAPTRTRTYFFIDPDGSAVYTNIPRRTR